MVSPLGPTAVCDMVPEGIGLDLTDLFLRLYCLRHIRFGISKSWNVDQMTGMLIFCTTRGFGLDNIKQCIHMLFSEESLELTSSSRSFIFWLRGRRSSTADRAMLQWLEHQRHSSSGYRPC